MQITLLCPARPILFCQIIKRYIKMQNFNENEVIDLTDPHNLYTRRNPPPVCSVVEVIDLDESSDKINPENNKDQRTPRKSKRLGHCSICWEQLGNKPLASTKCGHVYCLSCIQKCLKGNNRCPTCRKDLKGATAYHPLYLELL